MKYKFDQNIALCLWIASLLVLTGCSSDTLLPKQDLDETHPMVVFSVKVPDVSGAVATRSLTEAEEGAINTLQVLLFKDDQFKYTRYAGSKEEGGNGLFTFSVRLPKGEHDLVVVANSEDIIEKARLESGNSKEEVYNKLKLSLNADEKYSKKCIPLWGAKYDLDIKSDTDLSGDDAIKLLRMLAKVEVLLEPKAASGSDGATGNSNFAIQKVLLYNYNKAGYLAPVVDDEGNRVQNTTRIPNSTDTSKPIKVKGPLEYTAADDTSENNDYFTPSNVLNTIYTFEAIAGNDSQSKENICIVIGGSYKGGETTYYRLDFLDRGNQSTPMDIERNTNYRFLISEVHGPGFKTPDQAFEFGPFNMECKVLSWDASVIGDITFDGFNFYAIDPKEDEIGKDGTDYGLIKIQTDYLDYPPTCKVSGELENPDVELTGGPDNKGWLYDVKVDAGTVLEGVSPEAKEYKLTYKVAYNPNSEDGRTAYIHIQVGRLNSVVRITQNTVAEYTLCFEKQVGADWVEIESDQLFFIQRDKEHKPDATTYRISWTPKEANIVLHTLNSLKPIEWDTTLDNPHVLTKKEIEGNRATATFTVQPKVYKEYIKGSFDGRQDKIEVELKNTINEVKVKKTLSLYQQVQDIFIVPKVQVLDGNPKRFIVVKSNVPWNLYVNRNEADHELSAGGKVVRFIENSAELPLIKNPSQDYERKDVLVLKGQESNFPHGTKVFLTTVDDIFTPDGPKLFKGVLGLHAESALDNSLFDAKGIRCVSGIPQDDREANCYVLDPTQEIGILIPVRAANLDIRDKYKPNNYNLNLEIPQGVDTRLKNRITPASTNPNDKNQYFGAKLVWSDVGTDDGKGIGETGLLSTVEAVGKGDEGYILVMPGNLNSTTKKMGNAVVAVTRNPGTYLGEGGRGEILWSWHIWVTDRMKFYSPNNEKPMETRLLSGPKGDESCSYFLDRDLGAIDFEPDNPNSLGLFYQWGRHTPFRIYNSKWNLGKTIYDAKGVFVNPFGTKDFRSFEDLLADPSCFIEKMHSSTNIKDIWKGAKFDSRKSVFDPCPAGYRVPIKGNDLKGKCWVLSKFESSNSLVHLYENCYYLVIGRYLWHQGVLLDKDKDSRYLLATKDGEDNHFMLSIRNDVKPYRIDFVGAGSNESTVAHFVRCVAEYD